MAQGFTGKAHDPFIGEIAIVGSTTTAMATTLTATVLFDDHADIEAHQRAHIRCQAAISCSNQDALPDPGHAHGDLLNARIQRTGGGIDTLEQFDFLGPAEHFQRIVGAIQLGNNLAFEGLDAAMLPSTGNRAGSTGGRGQGFKVDGVTVGETGFLTGLSTYAYPLIKVETAFFDNAVFKCPGFRYLPLEVQVGGINAGPGQLTQH
ncbi:hypothetical protein D3C78_826020 [compost metagenome]